MLHPLSFSDYEGHAHKTPFVLKRPQSPDFWRGLFSKDLCRRLLERGEAKYCRDVTVSRVEKSGRRTNLNHNRGGVGGGGGGGGGGGKGGEDEDRRVSAADAWHRFEEEGASVRLLHPQRFPEGRHVLRLLSGLEGLFDCLVGCNTYLTPRGAQGFRPHYDDIDAFILQAEGEKRWQLWAPRSETDVNPLQSSQDFAPADLGAPDFEVTLRPGDLLYMPRGLIHCAQTPANRDHSLHLTVSTNQMHSWAHVLEAAFTEALRQATEKYPELRETPPLGYMRRLGAMHCDARSDERDGLLFLGGHFAKLVLLELGEGSVEGGPSPLDRAADAINVGFQEQRMPPAEGQRRRGAGGESLAMSTEAAERALDEDTPLEPAPLGCARLFEEGGVAHLVHSLANSEEVHAAEAGGGGGRRLEFDLRHAELLERVLTLRQPTPASELPDSGEDRREVLIALLEEGLLRPSSGKGAKQTKGTGAA
jgi:lysine-specific demethylase/histidyl-hydroxylase NO66